MKRIFAVVVATVILSGCANTDKQAYNSRPHVVNDVVISEPLTVDQETELDIARYTQIINHAQMPNDKMAQLYYGRGVIFDSLGLRTLAQLDFHRALELKPAYADAYNFLGIHFTLSGQYDRAFEAFDSALEIQPEHSYVHLNRGIALHYYGRDQLALDDLEKFYMKKVDDPYRAIWLYLAEQPADPEGAKLRLIYNANQLDKSSWAYQIVQLFLGKIEEQQFVQNLGRQLKSARELVERLCEGYFYLGKFKLLNGEEEAAKNYFRLSLSTNVYEFVEHKYSKVELNNLYEAAKRRFVPIMPVNKQQG
jgi:lipoprotein NlpI